MKILLFKVGAIGDVIMTTPMVRQIRKNFTDAKIDYLVGNIASRVIEGNSNINEIIKFDEKIFFKKNVYGMAKLASKIRKMKYDKIIVLDKHWIFGLFSLLTGIDERVGFDRMGKEGKFLTKKAKYTNEKHEIFYYLDLLKAMGCSKVDYRDWKTEMIIKKEEMAFAKKEFARLGSSKSVIGIAPGGGKNPGERTEIRNYPVEKYAEIIEKMAGKKKFIILIGGNQETEKERQILEILTPESRGYIKSFIGKTSLGQTAALISKCNYFICNDSGSMHIASCVNKKIISIFGPTDPKRKAPLWKGSHAIWKDRDIYEKEYELYGKKPDAKKRFFSRINVKDIISFIK